MHTYLFKQTLVLTALFSLTGCTAVKEEQRQGLLHDGKPTPALSNILELTHIEHDGTLSSIVQETQASWLRKPGQERWQMEDTNQAFSDKLRPAFQELGILDEVTPSCKNYDYAVLLGATLPATRRRLAYVLKLWDEGTRFKKLVFFVGARPLDPEREPLKELYNLEQDILPVNASWKQPTTPPATETEMSRMVVEQTQLPEGFQDVEIVYVDTPMQKNVDGTLRRPTTGDTIKTWLEQEDAQPGTILAISSQPYVGYQDAVLRTLLPERFAIETVGNKTSDELKTSVILDNIARWLYQENKRQQVKN